MTFILMTVILAVSNRPDLNRFTGLCAAALVASYIILEAPLSGMSLNPARTVGSAAHAAGVDRVVDLPHGAAPRHAGRGGASRRHPRPARRAVRQAASRQSPALHLPLQLRRRSRLTGGEPRRHHVAETPCRDRRARRPGRGRGLLRRRLARARSRGPLQPRRPGRRRHPQPGDRGPRHRGLEARGPGHRPGRLGRLCRHLREPEPARRRPAGGAPDGRGAAPRGAA